MFISFVGGIHTHTLACAHTHTHARTHTHTHTEGVIGKQSSKLHENENKIDFSFYQI